MKKIFLIAFMFSTLSLFANAESKIVVDSLIANKGYRFVAERVSSSLADRLHQLASLYGKGYYVDVLADSVAVRLPFFGRSYNPTMSVDQGFDFGNSKFIYEVKQGRKGKNTVVKIDVYDNNGADNYRMTFVILPEGRTTLTIVSNRRETISFDGYIQIMPEKNN